MNKEDIEELKEEIRIMKKFLEEQKDCPPKYIELVNKHFWDLV